MGARRRLRLVPTDAVEVFEVRTVLYFTNEGDAIVDFSIGDPDSERLTPPLHEVLGVLELGRAAIIDYYDKEVQ